MFKARRRELTRMTMPSDAGSLKVLFVMSFNHLLQWRRICVFCSIYTNRKACLIPSTN